MKQLYGWFSVKAEQRGEHVSIYRSGDDSVLVTWTSESSLVSGVEDEPLYDDMVCVGPIGEFMGTVTEQS